MTSESEVYVFCYNCLFLLGKAGFQMNGVAFNVNGMYGTDVFATSATHAHFLIGFGNGQTVFERDHVKGLYGTVLRACSAACALYVDYASAYIKYHMTGLGLVFLFNGKRLDGTVRTYLAADVAVIIAVSVIELHEWLHYASQPIFETGRSENMRRTLAYTQMT